MFTKAALALALAISIFAHVSSNAIHAVQHASITRNAELALIK